MLYFYIHHQETNFIHLLEQNPVAGLILDYLEKKKGKETLKLSFICQVSFGRAIYMSCKVFMSFAWYSCCKILWVKGHDKILVLICAHLMHRDVKKESWFRNFWFKICKTLSNYFICKGLFPWGAIWKICEKSALKVKCLFYVLQNLNTNFYINIFSIFIHVQSQCTVLK